MPRPLCARTIAVLCVLAAGAPGAVGRVLVAGNKTIRPPTIKKTSHTWIDLGDSSHIAAACAPAAGALQQAWAELDYYYEGGNKAVPAWRGSGSDDLSINQSATCPSFAPCRHSHIKAVCVWRSPYHGVFYNEPSQTVPDAASGDSALYHNVFRLSNIIVSMNGFIIGHSHAFTRGLCQWGRPFERSRNHFLFRNAFLLTHPYPTNYYHFIIEIFPQYFVLQQALPRLAALDAVLLITHDPRWNSLLTVFFNATAPALIARQKHLRGWTALAKRNGEMARHNTALVENAYVFYSPPCGWVHSPAIREVRYHYISNILPTLLGPGVRQDLIVLYKRTGARRVTRHAQLLAALQGHYGKERVVEFDGIYAENIRASLSILSRAAMFVGPHGAGFASIVFLPVGAHVFEWRPTRYRQQCFELIAGTLGIRFKYVMATGGKDTTLVVNEQEVLQYVFDNVK